MIYKITKSASNHEHYYMIFFVIYVLSVAK
jgi:hypothetical protein